jgi:hypothetical protein
MQKKYSKPIKTVFNSLVFFCSFPSLLHTYHRMSSITSPSSLSSSTSETTHFIPLNVSHLPPDDKRRTAVPLCQSPPTLADHRPTTPPSPNPNNSSPLSPRLRHNFAFSDQYDERLHWELILQSATHAIDLDHYYSTRDDEGALLAINIFHSVDALEDSAYEGDQSVKHYPTASILYHSRKIKTFALSLLAPTFADAAFTVSRTLGTRYTVPDPATPHMNPSTASTLSSPSSIQPLPVPMPAPCQIKKPQFITGGPGEEYLVNHSQDTRVAIPSIIPT